MNRSNPEMRAVAERLIAYEGKGNNPSETDAPAAFGSVIGKFRRPLASLTGEEGFRSLLSRALVLATAEIRWLRAVHVRADGALECSDLAKLDQQEIARGELAVLAQLLGLLETFIGEALTSRLVQDEWPQALLDNLGKSKEENEKTS